MQSQLLYILEYQESLQNTPFDEVMPVQEYDRNSVFID